MSPEVVGTPIYPYRRRRWGTLERFSVLVRVEWIVVCKMGNSFGKRTTIRDGLHLGGDRGDDSRRSERSATDLVCLQNSVLPKECVLYPRKPPQKMVN